MGETASGAGMHSRLRMPRLLPLLLGLCLGFQQAAADWSLSSVWPPAEASYDAVPQLKEHLDASQTVLQVIEEGVEVSLMLELSLRNKTWKAQHGHEVEKAARDLNSSWTRIKNILDLQLEDMDRPTVEEAKAAAGIHRSHEHPALKGFPVFFTILGLFITLAAVLYGPRLFDLFSPEVQSRWAVALCFALASLELVSWLRRDVDREDTMTLYISQLVLCFV
eukprot:CAMPEP_0206627194 /NCGR_PEP_ID=MMETSP0325_2-20121206/65790_1 /ASSEMBLY_ACC=CAM_ASM_000347 /TAXON_ID=2866 /ORGANISM="Crypthecodinium cohnii, Strain Seligo" /LENGTH=221 /DNA_ID=CAMNT_0054151731 /DNA_START=57 /DNA_END=719 /DNA_ORIENTATION=+